MSRNYIFNNVPTLKRARYSHDLSHTNFFSNSLGRLVPVLVDDILPGDQVNIDMRSAIRSTVPFIRPIMDNIYCDVYYFFVPYRLVFDKFEQFITGNQSEPSDWISPEQVDLPVVGAKAGTSGIVTSKSISDYLGFMPGTKMKGANVLTHRAIALIWNQFFRDENTQDSVYINTGDWNSETEFPNDSEWSPTNYFGACPPVCKFHDYFTSALRSPQKGSAVDIPLSISTKNPLYPNFVNLSVGNSVDLGGIAQFGFDNELMNTVIGTFPLSVAGGSGNLGSTTSTAQSDILVGNINETNLGVDLSDLSLSTVTINDLRWLFGIQRIFEREARGGSRYVEYLHSAFGVTSPDARFQRAEYLSGASFPINIQQVAQTAPTTSTNTQLAQVGAYSLTNGTSHCSKAFLEHGLLIGLCAFRQEHTYQQGSRRMFYKSTKFEFFDPALAYIGEQPIYNYELFNNNKSNGIDNNGVFGYQTAWTEYKYIPNTVHGDMRSSVVNTYDVYHLADFYLNKPSLTGSFLVETRDYVDRALGLSTKDLEWWDYPEQFICDFYFKYKKISEVPVNTVPGFLDHN